jgi:hypothetical protein
VVKIPCLSDDDLIQLGIVQNGPAVTIADGAQASPGDLIICTRNDHNVEAGEPRRTLANGDLLRIEAVIRSGLVVRRAVDADPATGQRRWTDRPFVYSHYGDAELGYAVTDHVAQGRTVHNGLAVITGTEDRQHAYVALTRGTDVNLAYVFTLSPKRADLVPGPGYRREPSHQAKWLWRTVHAAEMAGLDPGQVLADAIGERDLAGARDIASVIDARIRYRTGSLVPLPAGPWSARVPELADPERRAYLTEIATLMDARKDRLGEHAAGYAPPWALAGLGPVPAHPLDRLDWQKRAAAIGAWRELSGYHHPADPIGPEPAAAAPDLRAAWHEAFAALGPSDGPDVRAMPDGRLLHLRDTYPIETAWAPQYVGDELRQARAAAWDAHLTGLRASTEAHAAQQRGNHAEAARQHELAGSYRALHDAYRQREAVFAATMADRTDWDKATVQQRHLAVAADAELRRRHPGQHYPPLRSAEPQPATDAQGDELTMTAEEQTPEMGQWIKDLAAAHHTFADRLADRQSLTIPSEDPDYGALEQAFPPWPGPGKDAILQPPKPEIRPSRLVLERTAERDVDREAGS